MRRAIRRCRRASPDVATPLGTAPRRRWSVCRSVICRVNVGWRSRARKRRQRPAWSRPGSSTSDRSWWSSSRLFPALPEAGLPAPQTSRGWPADRAADALLHVAADPATWSPARLTEAGPWWDCVSEETPEQGAEAAAADLAGLEAELDATDGRRVLGHDPVRVAQATRRAPQPARAAYGAGGIDTSTPLDLEERLERGHGGRHHRRAGSGRPPRWPGMSRRVLEPQGTFWTIVLPLALWVGLYRREGALPAPLGSAPGRGAAADRCCVRPRRVGSTIADRGGFTGTAGGSGCVRRGGAGS